MIKKILLKIKYGYKSSNESYIAFLRKKGVTLGKHVQFFSPESIHVDYQYPFLIKMGDYVAIAAGCRFLTHDYSWAVIKRYNGDVLGSSGSIEIGNNVFIGSDTLILKNTKIGSNVIIGAGSLVSGNIPDGVVAVGRPAKPIMTIDEFIEKRKQQQLEEALNIYKHFVERYHEEPSEEVFREYFFLFENDYDNLSDGLKDIFKRGGTDYEEISIAAFKNSKPKFKSFEKFKKYCKENLN